MSRKRPRKTQRRYRVDEKTEAMIRELADKMGTTTEHLWGVLVKQAVITGSVGLAMYVLFAALLIAIGLKVRRMGGDIVKAMEDPICFALSIVFGVGTVSYIFAMLSAFVTTVSALVNPEYWALSQILP